MCCKEARLRYLEVDVEDERQSCEGCPDCEIKMSPDPEDWFCDDDVTVVCRAVGSGWVMAERIRPYLVHERCPIPHWCPRKKGKAL